MVYVPCLFWIKCYPDWTDGPRHIFRILSFSCSLPKEIFKVIHERIQYNSYFVHSENLLLSMICDQDLKIRREAYKRILTARTKNTERNLVGDVRVFRKPITDVIHPDNAQQYRYKLDHYSNIINWNEAEILEPPFTANLTDEQLKFYMNSNDEIIDIPRIPSHSQATELCVQLVKNIVKKYPGKEVQEERIKTKIFARSLNPQFKSNAHRKIDYQCYAENE